MKAAQNPNSRLLAIAAVLAAMLSVQSGAAIAKRIFPLVGPAGTSALRLLFGAIILCAFWRPWRKALTCQEKLSILSYGLSLGAMNLLFYMAIARAPLGIAVALEFTGPLAVALLSSKKPVDFLWALLAIVGIGLVLPLTSLAEPLDPLGIMYAFGAGLCWALYIVFGQRSGTAIDPGLVTSLGMVVGAALVLPFGIAGAGLTMFDPSILPFAIGIGFLASALPYTFDMFALRRLDRKNFGVLMSLGPATAALSGLALLGERLSVTQWIAIACVVTASIGSTLTTRPKKHA